MTKQTEAQEALEIIKTTVGEMIIAIEDLSSIDNPLTTTRKILPLYFEKISTALEQAQKDREAVDVEDVVAEFCDRHDGGDYPFDGEEYDLNLITFFAEWLEHQGYLNERGLIRGEAIKRSEEE